MKTEATRMNAEVDYQAVLADLKERREKIDSAIQAVESILASLGPSANTARVRSSQDIAGDAFLGLTIGEAAVAYLTLVRTAQTVAQIWEAIKKGGLPHTKYNATYNALNRREMQEGDLARLPDGTWGLSKWYPRAPSPARKTRMKAEVKPEQKAIVSIPAKDDQPQPRTIKRRARGGTGGIISLVDGCEQILREEGKPLHLSAVISKLKEIGRETKATSLSSTLRKDNKKRFINLGQNIWGLTEWDHQNDGT
jgi:DNA-directed RNA polymerase delta subunit